MEELLNFMQTEVSYNVKRLLPADLKEIYLNTTDFFEKEKLDENNKNPFDENYVLQRNFEFGGVNVTENVVYNCLVQEEWAYAIEDEICNTPFECPHCKNNKLGCSVFAVIQHEMFCDSKITVKAETNIDKDNNDTAVKANSKLFECTVCGKDLYLTPIDILKHKKSCK